MERDFWIKRWENHETGWHQKEVEPALKAQFAGLAPTKVFVPLCGKSLDLAWLASQGHEVVGVELSPIACQEFFKGNDLKAKVSTRGKFTEYSANGVTILNGDYFDVSPEHLAGLGAVYDRAALIALPPEMRVRYAAHLSDLIVSCVKARAEFRFLQVVIERSDGKGPPFTVTFEELSRLYGPKFRVDLIGREKFELAAGPAKQSVYALCIKP